MDNGKYRKVNDISLQLECPKCPVSVKNATIFNDPEKNLQLLRLTFSNLGSRSVDAIYLKLVFYDNYENVVPDNGKDYRIWGISGLSLQPDVKESAPKLMMLPGTEVQDCEIFITKIIYSDGEIMSFSESDYISPVSKIGQKIAIFDGKRGKKRLITAIAAVVALYALIILGTYLVKNVFIPMGQEARLKSLIENHRYEEALSSEKIASDPAVSDDVALRALRYYVDTEDYRAAVDTVSKIQSNFIKTEAVSELISVLTGAKRYDLAKELADSCEDRSLRQKVIREAIEYYCSINEYCDALEYASVSGDAECKHNICSRAIDFHLEKNDYLTALEYADKVGDTKSRETVYEAAVKNSCHSGDFASAALYIAQSKLYPNEAIDSEYIENVFSKLEESFIRANLEAFYPLMSLSRKQSLFATTIDVYNTPVGITEQNGVTGFSTRTWSNIVSVKKSQFNTVGLKGDGTVLVYGDKEFGQCGVSDWLDIVAIASGEKFTVGARSDGTVLAAGNNEHGQCDVSEWAGIVEVSAGKKHTVGLRADGTVVATGNNEYGQCNVSQWTDIIAISCGDKHTVGLRADGTVIATGCNQFGGCSISEWTDIVEISAGATHTVGLHANGTVILTGNTGAIYCGDVSTWCDVRAISAGDRCVMGLTSTGQILIAGDGAPSVNSLRNVKLPTND